MQGNPDRYVEVAVSVGSTPCVQFDQEHYPSSPLPEPTIRWYLNGTEVPEKSGAKYFTICTADYLPIVLAQDSVSVPIRVTAENEYGYAEAKGRVTIFREKILDHFKVWTDKDTLHHGDTLHFYAQAMEADERPMLYPSDVQLTCYLSAAGERLGSFLLADGSVVKEISDATYGQLKIENGGMMYVADGEVPVNGSEQIDIGVVKVGFRPKGGLTTITIKGESSLDHFELAFEKDTIAFTESAKIFMQAKDANEQDVELAADKLVTLSVTTNTGYGTFIDQNNDTLKTTPVKLEHIPYGDAKAGLIQFAAVKKNPVDPLLCKVKVELESDPTKVGEKEIPVVEQTLKIVMEGARQVRPSIPTEDRDTNMTKLRKKAFEVKMTRNGAAVPNHSFRLTTNYVEQSGGHDHGDTRDTRRADKDDNFGYFTIGQATTQHRPLNDVTNADGIFAVKYNASIFGDSIKIYLKSRDPKKGKFFQDSVTVVEKVDGLIDFRNVVANSRWTFSQTAQGRTRHSDNNWCNPDFSDSIQLAVDDFYEWTKTKKGGGIGIAVSLNDMSLSYGGRFDISGKWDARASQKHLFHRIGTSVDINRTLDGDRLDQLTKLMNQHQLFRDAERPEIHYGFKKGN